MDGMRPSKPKSKKELVLQVVTHLAKQITSKSKQAAPQCVLEAFQNLIDKIDEKSTYEKRFEELNGRITDLQSDLNHLEIRIDNENR
jgi:hypothetical protein